MKSRRTRSGIKASEAKPELVATPDDAARIARTVMNMEQETFVVLCINVRNVLIGEPFVAAIGTVTDVKVHPRDVFREAIRRNAAGVICLHNHPSGELDPSADDIGITRRLINAGELVAIPVLDHIIVTTNKSWSFGSDSKLWSELSE